MFSVSINWAFLAKLGVLCLAIAWIGHGDASACGGNGEDACGAWKVFKCDEGLAPNSRDKCEPCGRNGQVACEGLRPGKKCKAAYAQEVSGICRGRGGEGEPKLRGIGFDCQPGYNVGDDNVCTACGGIGQVGCEAGRPGKRCTAAYSQLDSDGKCEGRGGQGEAKLSGVGFDCRPGFNVGDNGLCTACGKTGQVSCEATRPGKRCTDAYTQSNSDGICEARGGEGQEKMRGIGFDCRPGFNIGSNGLCTACGGVNQVSCEPTRPGDRCTAAYTQENRDGICEPRGGNGEPIMTGLGFECRPGFNWRTHDNGDKLCEPCGSQGQPRCEALRPGDPCGAGLEVDSRPGRNYCVAEQPDPIDLVYEASKTKIREIGDSLFNAIVPMAFEVNDDQDTLEGIDDEDDGAVGDLEDDSRSFSELFDFKTLSVGAAAEANFIIGVGVETGVAFDISERDQDFKWYTSLGVSNQLGAGSSYGGVVGIWNVFNNELGKPVAEGGAQSVGIVFDVRTFMEFAGKKTSFLTDIGTQSSTATLLIGVWFERNDDATHYSDLEFTGFTFSPVLSVGTNIAGTTYVESTTWQSRAPAKEDAPLLFDLSQTTLAGGERINKCNDRCWLTGMGREIPVAYQPLPVLDVGSDSSLRSERARPIDASSGGGGTDPAGSIENSLWSFQVQGQTFYLKVLEETSNSIIVQRANSTEKTVYARSGAGTYRSNVGQVLTFRGNGTGIWSSADGRQTYPMVRAN